MKKQTSKTLLTGITGPTPDSKPDLKAIDIKTAMFFSKTVSDAVGILLTDLWYWERNQSKYPDKCANVAKAVRYHLIRLADKSGAVLPPVPTSITKLILWVLFVEHYLEPILITRNNET